MWFLRRCLLHADSHCRRKLVLPLLSVKAGLLSREHPWPWPRRSRGSKAWWATQSYHPCRPLEDRQHDSSQGNSCSCSCRRTTAKSRALPQTSFHHEPRACRWMYNNNSTTAQKLLFAMNVERRHYQFHPPHLSAFFRQLVVEDVSLIPRVRQIQC